MNTDELTAAFLYGLRRLHVNDDELVGDVDPHDADTMLWLGNQLYSRLADDTPYALCLHRLVMVTGALIMGRALGVRRKNLGREWLISRADVLELELAGNC